MPSFSEQLVEEIKSRTDIVDVIGSRIQLRRSGSDFSACCPFHKEKTPSFHVNPARQTYHCFGCGEGGDVFSFLMKHDGLTFGDALRMLGERCGVEVKLQRDDGQGARRKRLLEINAEASAFYMRCLKQLQEAQAARDYLASRDLSDDIVERFKIGYAPKAPDTLVKFARKHRYTDDEMVAAGLLSHIEKYGRHELHDRFRGRLMFSICDTQGRVVAFSGRVLEKNDRVAKYVNSPETPVFVKSSVLYALDKAQRAIAAAPNRRAIICEGQIDTIRCHACGFDTAVASQGTAFTEEHVRILKRYADSAVMVFDSDKAGLKATVRTAGLFLAAGIPVRAATLPEGEDPDSFLRARGHDAFERVLSEAEEIVPFQFRAARALEAEPDSVDALGRISAQLLETVGRCSNAVHRARMLQEAAALLKLPESALERELDGVLAENARREGRDAELARRRGEQDAKRQAADEIESILLPDEPGVGQAPSGSFSPSPGLEELGEETVVGVEGAIAPAPALLRASSEEKLLCELLIQHIDDEEYISFVSTYLPTVLLQHPYCAAIVSAIYQTASADPDAFTRLQQEADTSLEDFLGGLVTAPQCIPGDDDSLLSATHDLILRLWKHRFLEERDNAPDPADRIRRTIELRSLSSWDSGEPLILRAISRLTP